MGVATNWAAPKMFLLPVTATMYSLLPWPALHSQREGGATGVAHLGMAKLVLDQRL